MGAGVLDPAEQGEEPVLPHCGIVLAEVPTASRCVHRSSTRLQAGPAIGPISRLASCPAAEP